MTISTDIIVGFPNETEADFKETILLVDECRFDHAFTFIYSPRENTPAAKFEDNISLEEKENRLQRLNSIINQHFLENNQQYIDRDVSVLTEGKSEKRIDYYYGYSEEGKLINFKSSKDVQPGDIVSVKINIAKTWSLDGETNE